MSGSDRMAPVRAAVETLAPGYFALVMASGIVSVAMRNVGRTALSVALLWIAIVSWVVLIGVTGWRLVSYRSRMRDDIEHPERSFGFFTITAATDVVGTRLALDKHYNVGLALLILGWLTWLVLGYLIPWLATLGGPEHPLIATANGTWFVWVVASQSVAVLAAVLEPSAGHSGRHALALLAIFCWCVGVFLYASAGTFVAARLLFYPLRPVDLGPPYWIAMGATAITVLAGSRIVQMTTMPAVAAVRELVNGASVAFWAFGTWLLPALVAAGWWRHITHHVPLVYEAGLWSIVFPLGMYAAASHQLGAALNLPAIRHIGDYEGWVALAVWAVTLVAMLRHLARTLR